MTSSDATGTYNHEIIQCKMWKNIFLSKGETHILWIIVVGICLIIDTAAWGRYGHMLAERSSPLKGWNTPFPTIERVGLTCPPNV